MHVIICMPLTISLTRCPVNSLVNLTINIQTLTLLLATNTENEGHKGPANYNPWRGIISNTYRTPKVTRKQMLTLKLQTVRIGVRDKKHNVFSKIEQLRLTT